MKKIISFNEFLNESQVNEGKGDDLARTIISSARAKMKNLTADDLYEFRKMIAEAFDLKLNESNIFETEIKNVKDFEIDDVNEKAIDTKYWAGYNDVPGPIWQSEKSKDFKGTFSIAIDSWNDEADGDENQIKGAQVNHIKKLAEEFFKKEKYITYNIVQAMIMQES